MNRFSLRAGLDGDARERLVSAVVDRLAVGEVGIMPTETVYGIMCLYSDEAARERIYRMKSRDERKPLQVLVAGIEALAELDIELTPALTSLSSLWPGPLTVVVDDRRGASHGVRIPDHPFVLEVLGRLGRPLAATSANLSGQSPAESLASGFRDLAEAPDFVVDGELPGGEPSTVVRLRGDSPELIRQGALPLAAIRNRLAACGKES